jgi:hypothetical protein
MLLDWNHLGRQGELGPGVDQDDQLPAVDGDFDLLHPAPLIFDPPLAGRLATALVAFGRLQIGAIRNACDPLAKDPGLGQGPNHPVEQGYQVAQVALHHVVGQGIRTNRTGSPLPLALGPPPLADPLADLLGIEAHQLHQRLIAEQQARQGMHAFDAKQGLQPVEQEVLDEGEHLPLDGCPVDLFQQGHDFDRPQEVKEVVQQRPFVQPVHPVYQLLPIQAPRNARVVAPGDLPTQPFSQVLCDLVVCLSHGSPPSANCPFAIEESGP